MALEIFRLVGSIFVDTDEAERSLSKTDNKAAGVGATLLSGVKSAAKFGAALVAGASAAAAGLVALTESTREYRTEQAKLLTAFETAEFSGDAARTTYESLNSVLGDSGQAVEAANHLARLCSTEQQLADWTTIAAGVYGTFGDSIPIEGLTEAANETAKVGSVTGSLADALNWVGISEDEFNARLAACSSEQERAALITDTLNGAYSEAADTYKQMNGEALAANAAQDKLNASMATLGGMVEPIVTNGKQLVADVLIGAMPYLQSFAQIAFRDVVIDPISASYTAPAFVLLLCEKYNLFAEDARRILCGNVDVAGAYNPQAEKPTTIWDYLSGMKEALGGYISVRYADGSVYVDYTVQSGVVSEQHIIKGLNLVSIRTTIESEEYCTRVYPIGSDGTLINSVNGNKPVLINAEAEKLMGCVVNRLIEVNSTDPETIKNAGQKILNECSELQPQLQVSAIDRSGIDPTLPPFLTGQWAIVELPHADLETAVQIVEVKTDLLKPNNPQITLGSTPRKITTMLGGRK